MNLTRLQPKISRMELNTALKEGKTIDDIPTSTPKATTPGGPGSQWRMMKLRRVYESAEEEHRPVEEVALERFGSLAMFEEAQEERRILDERTDRRASKGPPSSARGRGKEPEFERRYMFTDVDASGASSRSSTFRRPDVGDSAPGTPSPGSRPPRARYDSMRLNNQGGGGGSALAQSHTPVPSVMTPTHAIPAKRRRALSPSSLNKLQAKVLRAKLMNSADAATLEKEYEAELAAANGDGADGDTQIEVLPTLDAQGRLYDVGQGKDDGAPPPPGNRKKKEKVRKVLQWVSAIYLRHRRWSKLETPRPATSSESTQTTTKSHSARCYDKNASEQVQQTRRISTQSWRAESLPTPHSRYGSLHTRLCGNFTHNLVGQPRLHGRQRRETRAEEDAIGRYEAAVRYQWSATYPHTPLVIHERTQITNAHRRLWQRVHSAMAKTIRCRRLR